MQRMNNLEKHYQYPKIRYRNQVSVGDITEELESSIYVAKTSSPRAVGGTSAIYYSGQQGLDPRTETGLRAQPNSLCFSFGELAGLVLHSVLRL